MNGDAPAGSAGRRDRRGTVLWWGPRLLFVTGAVVLVVESSRGVPLPELYAALGFFVLCSAVFVGRQLGIGHEPGPGAQAPRWLIRAAALLSAAGAAVLAAHVAGVDWDALPLVGSVLLLLGLGWFVEAWRGAAPGRPRTALLLWGTALLALAVLTAAVAALLLPKAKGSLFGGLLIALGVALFVLLPLGLNLLSEWGVRRLRTRRSAAGPGAGVGLVEAVALVVLGTVALACLWLVYRDWVLAAVLVAAALLLLPAVVSNTHADVALVLAALCLLASAPPEHPEPPDVAGGRRVLVALGDSYMSGEGASSYIEGTDDGGRDECRRSPSAYAVGLTTADRRFDRVLLLACSGARTFNLNPASAPGPSRVQPGEPGTQIDQLASRTPPVHPALVIVTVGGNDAGFAILGEACLAPGDCVTQKPVFVDNLAKVRRDLVATYRYLRAAVPADVPVVAVPYPQPIAAADRCSGVALTKAERDFVRAFVEQIDTTMRDAAHAAGITYMAEMKDSLAPQRLQLCQRRKGAAGINFVDVETVNGLAAQRFSPAKWLHNSLHPNERGHAAMRAAFTTWLDSHPELLPPAPPDQEPATGSAAAEPEPLCGMTFQAANAHCQVRIRAWELEQVRSRWPWLLLVLFALAVLWVASIAAFSLLPATGRPYRDSPARARAR
ncbi:GDSL-type esterase/lipase family protein [Streptomyces sp. NPDC056387]|uniref:GDSL-type esterase/lipase family protein n=1 Tax=Streptomyces sp. NPDC056387 TaxID=3345803 RepID=UPI0035D89C58